MEPQKFIAYGERVRLKCDFIYSNQSGIQSGDDFLVIDEKVVIQKHDPRRPNVIIPAETQGIIEVGLYCDDLYNYEIECPVKWNFDHPDIPIYLGTPWSIIEFAE